MPDRVIVRLPNWLGDTVMAVPALRALRGSVGDPLLLAGPWAALFRDQALADVLVMYPRSWSGRLRAADAVRDFRGSTAVLLPNSFEAAAAALYWGARRRIGFATSGRRRLLTDGVTLPDPRLHQVDEYALLAERAGATIDVRHPRLTPPAPASPERARVRSLLREEGAPEAGGRTRRVGIHLGAAYGPAKVWDGERIVEFCRLLTGRDDAPILLGAPGDAPFVAEIQRLTRAPSLAGRDAPELLPALLAELDALVCGDTGVAHLAAALGTPVAALFGPTDPGLTAPRGRVTVIRGAAPCAPCFYRTCPIDHPCMRSIEASEVLERLDALSGALV